MKLNSQMSYVSNWNQLNSWLADLVVRSRRSVDGHIGFGDGVSPDNIFGVWVTYVSNGVANTEDIVTHNLGLVPVGYLVFSVDKGAVIYKGVTAWSKTQLSLKSTLATTTALLFIVGNSAQDA